MPGSLRSLRSDCARSVLWLPYEAFDRFGLRRGAVNTGASKHTGKLSKMQTRYFLPTNRRGSDRVLSIDTHGCLAGSVTRNPNLVDARCWARLGRNTLAGAASIAPEQQGTHIIALKRQQRAPAILRPA